MCRRQVDTNSMDNSTSESKLEVPPRRDPRLDVWPEERELHSKSSCSYNPFRFFARQIENWTFSYMNLVLARGAAQGEDEGKHLTFDDLYSVPKSMEASFLVQTFSENHIKNGDEKVKFAGSHNLLQTLWKIAAPNFIPAGFCELLVVLCGTALPLLIRELLAVIENNPGADIVREGLGLAICVFVVVLLNGVCNHRHRHLALKTGICLRATLVNVLYQHIMDLTPDGKKGLTSGEVTNLVAVDTQKLFEVTQDGHLIWALPLNILLVSFFLYRTLGPSTLVGIGVLVGFVPIIQTVTKKMLSIRQKRVFHTDKRVELVSNMLQGIKVAKLNSYEQNYLTRVTALRNEELRQLSLEMAVWATTLLMTVTSPVLATGATFATYVLLNNGNILTAADTFGVLLLFSALRFPINFAGRLVGKAAQAISAIKRISNFMDRPVRNEELKWKEEASNLQDGYLKLSHASFRVGGSGAAGAVDSSIDNEYERSTNTFTVSEFNFSIKSGEVLAICGPVGSGKTTLLNGILQDAEPLGDTSVAIEGELSYAPQTPFILNQTIRENILFGLPYEENRYNQVLDACALITDLEQLGDAGDLTEIGERGVTLSGGQKQRISLARAAYAKSKVYILDDPFSALDSGTGKTVFERLIASKDALLKDSAILLVTHASHFITHRSISKILLLVEGRNRFMGSWEDLGSFHPEDANTQRAVDHIKSSTRENIEQTESENDDKADSSKDSKNKTGTRLIKVEEREHGVSSLKTWLLWFQRAGGWRFMSLQLLLMGLDRFLYVGVEWFLAKWTAGAETSVNILGIDFPSQQEGKAAQGRYLWVYTLLIFVSFLATAARSEWAVTGGGRAARNVFERMLKSVLAAPISYFETVPMGRILNRFTYDTDINDVTLTQIMSMFMISCSWYVAGVSIQCTILPWSALAIFPVSAMYWYLMLYYRMSGPDLQRIDALSRSPLQSMVSECLEGSTSIRLFKQGSGFTKRFRHVADCNSSALLNFVSAQRWLGARMELLGSFVVLTSTVLVVLLNEKLDLDPGLVGLLILWSGNFTITLNFLVDTFSEAEAAITAIERVDAMAELPSEKPMNTDPSIHLHDSWPDRGLLKFDDVCLRYRDGLPLALNQLTFEIPAGKRCGVVGRTGAGKSSIAVALFRLVELESGSINLDGVDLSLLGLRDVRGRGMAIIPQDPFLVGATLREALDPFNEFTDEAVFEALEAVRLANPVSIDAEKFLSSELEEGGANYSVGERQLLNLARALLFQPRVLVLDEATASIDGETDHFIQNMLRTRFPNTTLLTIAHRLNTIMDYDTILVMEGGQAAEFGPPEELLKKKAGIFTTLVDATGPESSTALKDIAFSRKQI